MTIFQTTSNYVSELSVQYDAEKERFLGEFTSRGGLYRIEGVNMADLSQEMERLLREEYYYMQREAAQKKSYGRGRGGGDTVDGMKVHTYDASDRSIERQIKKESGGLGRISKWVDLVTGGIALASGNWLEVGITAATLTFGEWFDNVESLWDKSPEKKIFAVSFGGILITATSRRKLFKKLQRQKNKRIHRIMMSIRKAGLLKDDPHDESSNPREKEKDKQRLKNKKKRAEILRPKSWERRVSPQGVETGWRSRSLNLRNRLKDKKERSRNLWTNRLLS